MNADKGRVSQDPSDQDLVKRTLTGDRDSYRELVERYQGRLLAVASDILKNRQDAEDVVQESFVKAFLSLKNFKGESSFYTWLYRIAFNMAIDTKRRGARRGGNHFEFKESWGVRGQGSGNGAESSGPTVTSSLEHLQNVEGPFDALSRKELGSKLQAVMNELSEEHRAVITLREVDGLDYQEIADAIGVPRGTVMSRLFYARKALQKALQEYGPAGGYAHDFNDREEGEDVAVTSSQEIVKAR